MEHFINLIFFERTGEGHMGIDAGALGRPSTNE